ncbi:MAG: type II secretion system F family protein [Calditrichia bacterium]
MPVFEYKALNKKNIEISDVIEASNETEAIQTLQKMGFTPISIVQKKAQLSSSAFGEMFQPKVKTQTLIQFTRQLRTMLSAGIALLEALTVLENQAEDKFFQKIINGVRKEVEGGNQLSSALGMYPKVFSRLYVNSVRIGEVTGNLDSILQRLEEFIVFDERTKKNVKKALRYPTIVMTGVIGAVFFFSMYVIPKFKPLFELSGQEIPLPTKIVLGFSEFTLNYGYILLILLILTVGGIIWYKRTPMGKYNWDKFMLQLPIFGELIQMVELTRFTKTFQTLNKSGIAVVEAFETIIETIDNEIYRKEIKNVLEGLKNGEGIAPSMKRSPYFTQMVIQMIAIGEKAGSLDDMLGIISDFYDEEVENKVAGLTAMIEPIVTVVMGVIVLVLVLALFLPMWNAAASAGSGL